MSDRRVFRWATTSARLLAATIASVAAVIAIVTAISFPWPTIVREPVSVLATPAPAASVIVCDGGLLTLGRDLEDASDIAIATTQSVISGAAEGAPPPLETRLTTAGLAPGDGPLVFTAPPEGRRRVDVAASGSATVVAPDISGFAASACRPPLMESWLVGGSAATGAADIVIVSNPGTVAATVQLTAFGANGPITPPGGADLVVPPATQRLIPLAGLVLGESAPVIRVSAVGAPVHASLQTSITRTLTPGGADQVGPVQAPEPRQTSVGGGQPEPPRVIPLSGGQPTEIELGGLPVGVYTVEVAADQPVVAAVWQTTGFDEGSDFAWYSASPLVSAPSLFATPAGPPPSLTIVNPDDEEAVVSITSADGSFRLEVTVPAGGSTIARLSPRTVYEFDPGRSGIRAGLSLAGDGALAGITVWPADAAAPLILVYP
jgi:hypothetical protein